MSNPARAVSEAPSFTISLHIKHPTIDPDLITQTLGVTPDHSWACGEPKRTGGTAHGVRRNSFWCATLLPQPTMTAGFADLVKESAKLPRAMEIPNQDFATSLSVRLLMLRRHQEFIQRLVAEGGELSFVVELQISELSGFKMDPSLTRQLGALGATLEFQFV